MAMGTPLGQIIDEIAGGARPGRRLVAAMSGVANPLVTADHFDTPASHEAHERDRQRARRGRLHRLRRRHRLRRGGLRRRRAFSRSSRVASAHRARKTGSRSRASSIGCAARKPPISTCSSIDDHLRTVTEGARCFLATQQQQVIASIMELEGEHLGARARGDAGPADPILIGPLADIRDGEAVLDEHQLREAARLELRRRRLRSEPRGAVPRAPSERRPHHVAPRAGGRARRTCRRARAGTAGACTRRWRCPRSSCTAIPRSGSTRARRSTPTTATVVVIHEQDAGGGRAGAGPVGARARASQRLRRGGEASRRASERAQVRFVRGRRSRGRCCACR